MAITVTTVDVLPSTHAEQQEARTIQRVITARLRDGMTVEEAKAFCCAQRPENHRFDEAAYKAFVEHAYGSGCISGDVEGFEKHDPSMNFQKLLGGMLKKHFLG